MHPYMIAAIIVLVLVATSSHHFFWLFSCSRRLCVYAYCPPYFVAITNLSHPTLETQGTGVWGAKGAVAFRLWNPHSTIRGRALLGALVADSPGNRFPFAKVRVGRAVTSFMAITATLGFFVMFPATDGSAHGYNIRKNCARACLTALLFDNELPDRQLQENGNGIILGLYWGNIGIMENQMETTVVAGYKAILPHPSNRS